MGERAGLFEDDLDLSQFTVQRPVKAEPPAAAVRAVAEGVKFQSREPAGGGARQQRRYRTGRNIQMNTKVTLSTRNGFYEISDRYNWVLGETLERALEALKRELDKEGPLR